jgi:hypothetical protein
LQVALAHGAPQLRARLDAGGLHPGAHSVALCCRQGPIGESPRPFLDHPAGPF